MKTWKNLLAVLLVFCFSVAAISPAGAMGKAPKKAGAVDPGEYYDQVALVVGMGQWVLQKHYWWGECSSIFSDGYFTSQKEVPSSVPPPDGYSEGPASAYNLTCTAGYSVPVTLGKLYDDTGLSLAQEQSLELMKLEAGAWVDITTSVDTVNNMIYTQVNNIDGKYLVAMLTDPAGALQGLINTVQSLNLQQGIENSLDKKLENAQASLASIKANNRQDAINKLQAFVNECQAQRGVHLTIAQADQLIKEANQIIAALQ